MSRSSAAAVLHAPSLADAVDTALAAAFDDERVDCLWCGAAATPVLADRFTGRVLVRCPECGAELESVRPRRTGEVRA
jgi:hypothetical protein